jgi:E3 ubiquitin-protein ligase MARCH6
MEWLSHSQKKYCELCKTPFRFTKLYHPEMPPTLPTAVFLRRAAVHLLSHLVTACRALLVISVWLIILPSAMRGLWRVVFWFADAGWARVVDIESSWYATATNITIAQSSASNMTKPFVPGEPFLYRIVKTILTELVLPASMSGGIFELEIAMNTTSTDRSDTRYLIKQKYSSLLSEVRLFKRLTSMPIANRMVMDIAEGLIITLCVVVAFILVFLIREWVIQQQPIVDIGADAENALIQAGGEVVGEDEDAVELEGPIEFEDFPDADTSSASMSAQASRRSSMSEPNNAREENESASASQAATDRQEENDSEEIERIKAMSDALSSRAEALATQLEAVRNENNRALASSSTPIRESRRSGMDLRVTPPGVSQEMANRFGREPPGTMAAEMQRRLDGEALDAVDAALPPISHTPMASTEDEPAAGWKGKGPAEGFPDALLFEDSDLEDRPFIPPDARNGFEEADKVSSGADTGPFDQTSAEPSGGADGESAALPSAAYRLPAEESESQQAAEEIPAASTDVVPTARRAIANRTWAASLYDFFWGDIVPIQDASESDLGNDEHVVDDLDDEEPFVPFAQAQPVLGGLMQGAQPDGQADEGDEPAEEPDDADDVEDLEGVLELIGMNGPLIGLLQNAVFCSLIITATVLGTAVLPYLLGKQMLVFLVNVELLWILPLQTISIAADLIADILLFLGGHLVYALSSLVQYLLTAVNILESYNPELLYTSARNISERAGSRLLMSVLTISKVSEMSLFLVTSMESHLALHWIREGALTTVQNTIALFTRLGGMTVRDVSKEVGTLAFVKLPLSLCKSLQEDLVAFAGAAKHLWKSGQLSLTFTDRLDILSIQSDPSLAYWSATDRLLAIIVGYGGIFAVAAFYVNYVAPVTSGQARRVEAKIVDIINQAGGVVKVIFIISIEMIAFPLFCGFLLDMALLPVFEHATLPSRITWTLAAPWTSGFVHWFVGTCYMFHFALFVSMCRKIMRSGVLYFIRDPDDPTFHPVRDVLERSVTIQLRKIASSAVVYGALIFICLGGVVWTLWAVPGSILPIRWTSSESALEFPLDILFYNFLTPLVVRFTKPADLLQGMYRAWFRKCASYLRLSHFLFNDQILEEEGHYIRRTWKAWVLGAQPPAPTPYDSEDETTDDKTPPQVPEVYFQPDGRYARVPANDQIRIPKGSPVFVYVDESNSRLDGKSDIGGIHGRHSPLVTRVYIPPWFQVRIALFVLAVWLFAAATGLSVTIVPLICGRQAFKLMGRDPAKTNDIYAFSLGIYVLGALVYAAPHVRGAIAAVYRTVFRRATFSREALRAVRPALARAAAVAYVYSALALALPVALAVVLELYVLLPLHVYFGSADTHVVHLVQDWTLGILWVRIASRVVLAPPANGHPDGAAADESTARRVWRAVVHGPGGPWDPDARAATRAFVAPAALAFAVLTLVPFAAASAANATLLAGLEPRAKVQVLRLVYPASLAAAAWAWVLARALAATVRWRGRIKDEAYLIGERLHNFGDRAKGAAPPPRRATVG